MDHANERIIQTEEGIFALTTRPTKPSWPGPLIIYYFDKVPADTPSGEEPWEVAVAHGYAGRDHYLSNHCYAPVAMNRAAVSCLPPPLPPRGLPRGQAAEYIGVGVTKFDEMVDDGRMLAPKRVKPSEGPSE